ERLRNNNNSLDSNGWRFGTTNGADHPRFRGSKLYAYTFRNLFWTSLCFFLIGMLLRVFVIGPSFYSSSRRIRKRYSIYSPNDEEPYRYIIRGMYQEIENGERPTNFKPNDAYFQ